MEASQINPTPVPPRPRGAIRSALGEVGEMAAFGAEAVVGLRRTPRYLSEVLRQASILVRGSTVIIFAMVTFIGMTAVNFAYFFLRAAGASDYTGLFSGIVMPRARTRSR